MSRLEQLLTDHLRSTRPERRPRVSRFYASDSMSCHRQRWYKAKEVPQDFEPDGQGYAKMQLGNVVHDFYQGALVAVGAKAEVGWRREPLGGRADLYLRTPVQLDPLGLNGDFVGPHEDECPCIGEIKTKPSYAFRKIRNSQTPEMPHVIQAACSALELEARSLWMIYVSRDMECWDIVLQLTDELRAAAELEMRTVIALDNMEEVPDRYIPGTGNVDNPKSKDAPWQCRYCNFRNTCANDGG